MLNISNLHDGTLDIFQLAVTLLSVCHPPSVLADDRPMYAYLAGINELETNLCLYIHKVNYKSIR